MTANFLRIRESIVMFYRNHEGLAQFILKFVAGLILFANVNSLGFYREGFAFSGNFLWTVGMSALFAVAPAVAGQFLLLLAVVIQVSQSLELMLIIFLLGVMVLIFYSRLQPSKSFIIILMILGFYFRIPYLVVILAGLYIGFAAITPVVIGTAIWNVVPIFQ
ncbi:MAG: hypothetical protein FWC95_04410, partial [Defluviitaleaceae bacterium]|nr:hypothetical protein [Defluviitaleaceae bacterium]